MGSNFNVLDFEKVAHFLMKDKSSEEEAFIRTAVGRIYYSVYLVIRAKAKTKNFREMKNSRLGGIHEQLIEYLKNISGDENCARKISKNLSSLKKLRTDSDYESSKVEKKHFDLAIDLFKDIKLTAENSDWKF